MFKCILHLFYKHASVKTTGLHYSHKNLLSVKSVTSKDASSKCASDVPYG